MGQDPVSKKYILVTGATADSIEAMFIGLKAHDTPLGVLVEDKPIPDISAAMDRLDRALNPNKCRCPPWSITHRPDCRASVV